MKTLLRPRTLIYFGIWSAIGLGLLFMLGNRTRIDISALQDRNPLFVRLSDGTIRNSYVVKVRNMETRPRDVEVGIVGLPGAVFWQAEGGQRENATRTLRVRLAPDSVTRLNLLVAAPDEGAAKTDFAFTVLALDREGGTDSDEISFDRAQP